LRAVGPTRLKMSIRNLSNPNQDDHVVLRGDEWIGGVRASGAAPGRPLSKSRLDRASRLQNPSVLGLRALPFQLSPMPGVSLQKAERRWMIAVGCVPEGQVGREHNKQPLGI
jgi:hypothetical protein